MKNTAIKPVTPPVSTKTADPILAKPVAANTQTTITAHAAPIRIIDVQHAPQGEQPAPIVSPHVAIVDAKSPVGAALAAGATPAHTVATVMNKPQGVPNSPMGTGIVSTTQPSANSSGSGLDTIGGWIKDIENNVIKPITGIINDVNLGGGNTNSTGANSAGKADSKTDYTPLLIGGAIILALILLSK